MGTLHIQLLGEFRLVYGETLNLDRGSPMLPRYVVAWLL